MSTNRKNSILTESGTNELEIIEFSLIKHLPDGSTKVCYYGINVAKVREVIRVPVTTEYPNSQPNVLGVFSLRGTLIPLVDLASWLRIPVSMEFDRKVVIVTDFNRMTNGFLVDSVSRIHRISWEDVESTNQFLESSEQDCVVAVVRQKENLIMILDFEKIIADINPELSMEKYDVTLDKHVVIDDTMVAKREAKTIMVVDDSAFIRRLIKNTLRAAGYNVISAKDGGEALASLTNFARLCNDENKSINEFVDGIVSDVEMPQMDGMHLIKRLREIDEYRTIPIVLFSSLMSDDNRKKALDLGANDTITKPEIAQLVGLVDKLVLK